MPRRRLPLRVEPLAAFGELHFTYETLLFPDIVDQSLIAYGYPPDSPTAERLRILLSWNTSDLRAAQQAPEGVDGR